MMRQYADDDSKNYQATGALHNSYIIAIYIYSFVKPQILNEKQKQKGNHVGIKIQPSACSFMSFAELKRKKKVLF